jgi:hypothetical protein
VGSSALAAAKNPDFLMASGKSAAMEPASCTPWTQTMVEFDAVKAFEGMPERVARAFDSYIALGRNRSLKALAGLQRPEGTGRAIATLKRWSIKYQWQEWLPSVRARGNGPVLSINEAADFLCVSKSMMKRLIYTKKVATVRVGSRVLVLGSSLLGLLNLE